MPWATSGRDRDPFWQWQPNPRCTPSLCSWQSTAWSWCSYARSCLRRPGAGRGSGTGAELTSAEQHCGSPQQCGCSGAGLRHLCCGGSERASYRCPVEVRDEAALCWWMDELGMVMLPVGTGTGLLEGRWVPRASPAPTLGACCTRLPGGQVNSRVCGQGEREVVSLPRRCLP